MSELAAKKPSNDIPVLTDLYLLHIGLLLHNIRHPEIRDAGACYVIILDFRYFLLELQVTNSNIPNIGKVF